MYWFRDGIRSGVKGRSDVLFRNHIYHNGALCYHFEWGFWTRLIAFSFSDVLPRIRLFGFVGGDVLYFDNVFGDKLLNNTLHYFPLHNPLFFLPTWILNVFRVWFFGVEWLLINGTTCVLGTSCVNDWWSIGAWWCWMTGVWMSQFSCVLGTSWVNE